MGNVVVSCDILFCATMSCDQDREPPNVGPLQKKFVRHNGLTKMLCATQFEHIFVIFYVVVAPNL